MLHSLNVIYRAEYIVFTARKILYKNKKEKQIKQMLLLY